MRQVFVSEASILLLFSVSERSLLFSSLSLSMAAGRGRVRRDPPTFFSLLPSLLAYVIYLRSQPGTRT